MSTPFKPPALLLVTKRLREMHGDAPKPMWKDVYEAALWECASYLVDDERRTKTFERLKHEIGLEPKKLLKAEPKKLLAAISDGGMLPDMRAIKVREAAAIAEETGRKELAELVRESPKAARKILKKFPNIGDPGADWLLLLGHGQRSIAPESNALRVLTRLGYGQESKNYGREYRSAVDAAAPELPETYEEIIALRQSLRIHGQTLCRRSDPDCGACSLAPVCRYRLGAQ